MFCWGVACVGWWWRGPVSPHWAQTIWSAAHLRPPRLRRPALSCFIQTHSEAIISSHLYKEKIVYSRIIFIIFSFYTSTFIAGRYKIYFCMILADNHEHNWHILQKYVIHQFGAHGMFNHFHYINFLSSKFSIIIIKTTSKNILHSEKFSAFQNEIYYFYLPSGFQGRSSSTNNIWKLSRNLEYTRLPNLVKHISTYRLIADCGVVM